MKKLYGAVYLQDSNRKVVDTSHSKKALWRRNPGAAVYQVDENKHRFGKSIPQT